MAETGTGRAAITLVLVAMLIGCGSDPAPSPVLSAEPEVDAAATDAKAARADRPKRQPAHTRRAPDEGNHPPVVRSLTVNVSEEDPALWVADIKANDADGDEVTLDIVWYVNGQPAARGERTYDPTSNGRGDAIHVEVTPHDGKVSGATAASGPIRIENAAPSITSTPPATMAGGVYRYMVEASDPEGASPLRYELLQKPEGMQINGFTGELTWRPAANQVGTHTIEIAVSDSSGARSTQEFALPIVDPDAPPASPDL